LAFPDEEQVDPKPDGSLPSLKDVWMKLHPETILESYLEELADKVHKEVGHFTPW
jgi:hypothetical protein